MRILRNCKQLPIISLCVFSIAARVGFIASTLILLMSRFQISPILSACTSIALQGSITMMRQISEQIFRKYTMRHSQMMGAILGASSCLVLLIINNIAMFLFIVFIASFSKVAIESTFPRVTHEFLVEDDKFSSRLIGSQQVSVLAVCAIIAPLALAGSVLLPMAVSAVLYLITLLLVTKVKACSSDSYEEVIDNDSTNEKFARRFGDIERNERIRDVQSGIHKFRRVPSTLLSIDLFVNIVGAGCVVLMPICFKEISHIPQAMDPVFTFTFGIFAAITGLIALPFLRRKFVISEKLEWVMLALILPIGLSTSILFSTIAGVKIALISAALNGAAISFLLSLMHQIAARNLTQMQYQKFGCQQMQRNAISRMVFPLVIGTVASVASIQAAFGFLTVLALVFVAITSARVILIVHGRNLDQRALISIENSSHPARKLRTNRRTRSDIDCEDTRIVVERLRWQSIRSREKFAAYNRLRFRHFVFWAASSLPQKDSNVDAAGRAPG